MILPLPSWLNIAETITEIQKSEGRDQKSEVRSQKSAVSSRGSGKRRSLALLKLVPDRPTPDNWKEGTCQKKY